MTPWDPKALHLLCGNCGVVAMESTWLYPEPENGDHCICPACGCVHRDTDDDTGVWMGSHAEMVAQRRELAPEYDQAWTETGERVTREASDAAGA